MAITREARENQTRRPTAAIIGSSLSLQRSSFSSPLCISYSIYQGEAINIFALNNHEHNLNHHFIISNHHQLLDKVESVHKRRNDNGYGRNKFNNLDPAAVLDGINPHQKMIDSKFVYFYLMTFSCFYILAFILHSFFNQFSPLFDFQRHVASPAALLYLLVQEKVGPICRRKLVNPVSVRRGFCIKTHSRGDPRSYLSSF